ncbi:hypothetical protein E2C01_023652 [Portunus trituberculatus]|uniref:Uncharacterized protein n=1 Tax=Portunus trituberculatus TaxID=210409 RepID=A0A5B7EAE7_PORTR|nr:hypothetical protein [Portunus trituberculatus]
MHLPRTNTLHLKFKNKKRATPNPASASPCGEGTRHVPKSDCYFIDDPKCLDTSLNINFYNIRRLITNFQSVEHHLSST